MATVCGRLPSLKLVCIRVLLIDFQLVFFCVSGGAAWLVINDPVIMSIM